MSDDGGNDAGGGTVGGGEDPPRLRAVDSSGGSVDGGSGSVPDLPSGVRGPDAGGVAEDPFAGLEKDWWRELLVWRRPKGDPGGEPEVWVDESLNILATTDLDGSRSVVVRYAGWLTHSDKLPGWRIWNGRIHAPDEGGLVSRIGTTYADAYDRALRRVLLEFEIPAELERKRSIASGTAAGDARKVYDTKRKAWLVLCKDHIAYARRLRSDAGQNALLGRLAVECAVDEADFDRTPGWLVMGNGVFDLEVVKRTKRLVLLEHSMNRMITQGTEVAWLGEEAECAWFMWYLERSLPSAALRWYLQKWMGACLLGGPKEKALLNLIGDSDSGKTVMLNVMKACWGDYIHNVPVEVFLASKIKDQFAKHELRGKRLVTAVEPGSGRSMDDSVIKELTGGDPVTSRAPYGKYVVWQPQCVIAISSNFPMRLDTADMAMMRRLRPIEFGISFSDEAGTPPERKMDKELLGKIKTELPGVAAWCLRGLLGYLKEGMAEPVEVTDKREAMAAEMDSSLEWVLWAIEEGQVEVLSRIDAATVGTTARFPLTERLAVGEAHVAYMQWCESQSKGHPQGSRKFSEVIGRRFGRAIRTKSASRFPALIPGPSWPSYLSSGGVWSAAAGS